MKNNKFLTLIAATVIATALSACSKLNSSSEAGKVDEDISKVVIEKDQCVLEVSIGSDVSTYNLSMLRFLNKNDNMLTVNLSHSYRHESPVYIKLATAEEASKLLKELTAEMKECAIPKRVKKT